MKMILIFFDIFIIYYYNIKTTKREVITYE